MSFNKHVQNPFSVYGEMIFLGIQGVIIVFLIWLYRPDIPTTEKIFIGTLTLSTWIYLFSDMFVPEYLWPLSMNLQFVLIVYARLPQIFSNYKHQSTGQLSLITCALNSAGTAVRLLTHLKEGKSQLNLISGVLSFTVNLTLTIQIIIYWNNKFGANNKTPTPEQSTQKPRSKPKRKIE